VNVKPPTEIAMPETLFFYYAQRRTSNAISAKEL
jgi:hypothetical protein